MRLHFTFPAFTLILTSLLSILPTVSALRLIESKSLNPCQDNSSFTATLFNVVFTPDNNTLAFDVVGVSSIQGNVTAELQVIAYGFTVLRQKLDPCTMHLRGLCPMNTGQINIQSNIDIPNEVIQRIPGMWLLEVSFEQLLTGPFCRYCLRRSRFGRSCQNLYQRH